MVFSGHYYLIDYVRLSLHLGLTTNGAPQQLLTCNVR